VLAISRQVTGSPCPASRLFCVTGQEKAGEAGVKRQYMGCAGRVANGINTVHLSYVRARTGHALIDARQWSPQEHIEDRVKSLVMGLPY
jgi:SRSO17 transposase